MTCVPSLIALIRNYADPLAHRKGQSLKDESVSPIQKQFIVIYVTPESVVIVLVIYI